MAERSTQKKDKEISKLVIEKDIVPVKSLEGDKRFLHNEIKKLQEQKTIMERTIQIQDKKLEAQKQKFESITQALKETKVDKLLKEARRNPEVIQEKLSQIDETGEEEMISSSVVDVLLKDIDELRKLSNERDNILSEKDLAIESLERKIDVLEKSKISDQKLLKKKIVALQDQIASLQDSITTTELNFKQKENNLKREKFALKKTLNQSMTRPNTASALQ